MLRSYLTFQALGFDVQHAAVPLSEKVAGIQSSMLALREYFGLLNYFFLGRFNGYSVSKSLEKSEMSIQNFPDALKCRIR